jgi:hypothetical protein
MVVPQALRSLADAALVQEPEPLALDLFTGQAAGTGTGSSWWDPTCCNDRQTVFIVEYACLFVGSVILWRSRLLLPMKLFSVFLHELGHAMMAWACCGKVSGIEVHSDQGGLTHFSGVGKYAIFWILPAGYLGSAIWACAIVILSGGDTAAVVISFILCFFLFVALIYSFIGDKERFGWALPLICLFNLAILIPLSVWCIVGDYYLRYRILEAWLIFLGGVTTVNASWDIVEDTIARTVERSDAYRFADMVPCCFPKCVGFIWLLLSVREYTRRKKCALTSKRHDISVSVNFVLLK